MENQEFELLLEKYDYKYRKGDIIEGTICGYDGSGVVVDIGTKAAALCPDREVSINDEAPEAALPKGEKFEFIILKEEDDEGRFLLSRKKVAQAYVWKELEQIKAQDEIIEGTVVNVVKGGVIVDVAGIKGFVPSSHLRAKDSNLTPGSKLELKIITLDMNQNAFVLSNRNAVGNSDEDKVKLINALEVGQTVEGEVVRITDFGAFIDIGGIDGLLPLSQISWRWVEHPQDVLKIGQTLKVQIISVDISKSRVSLSLKNLESDPWIEVSKTLKEGEEINGTITRIKSFGAFVEIAPAVEALLPAFDINQYETSTGKKLSAGQEICTIIQRFAPEERRISLTIKPEK